MSSLREAAKLLISARVQNTTISTIPSCLQSLSIGYEMQKEMIALATPQSGLGKFLGWKIGATNNSAQSMLGVSSPFYGPLFESNFKSSSTAQKISIQSLGNVFKAVEAEIAIVLKNDLPFLPQSQYSPEDLWRNVEFVIPAIEFAATRFSNDLKLTPAAIVSDFALNGCVVLSNQKFKTIDFPNSSFASIANYSTSLHINSALITTSSMSSVLENPINSLTWLANELNSRQDMLKAGQIIMTGAAFQFRELKNGDKVSIRFDHSQENLKQEFQFEIVE
jgi:2-keto-4-pentenoate hydratase